MDRLRVVLKTGVDVEPSNSVIWANDLEKALEYGDWPKVVMAFDSERLKRSWIEIEAGGEFRSAHRIIHELPCLGHKQFSVLHNAGIDLRERIGSTPPTG